MSFFLSPEAKATPTTQNLPPAVGSCSVEPADKVWTVSDVLMLQRKNAIGTTSMKSVDEKRASLLL